MIPFDWIELASRRIADTAVRTPITFDKGLNVYFKWESKQITGSFKLRGALNKVLSMPDWERERGLVTASAGNAGQGVAVAARMTGAKAIVFASEHAPMVKLQAMRNLGSEGRLVPGGYAEAESAAIKYAREQGKTWISPYNDGQVIAGQGTVGLELLDQIQPFDISAVIVPVGSGGLISGIGAAFANHQPQPRLIGVQSTASAYMHALYNHRSQDEVREVESIADGLSGRNEDDAITIPLVRKLVDEFILVSEEEIEKAIVVAWERYHEVIEGSAAVTLAAVLFGYVAMRPAILIISGGNIQPEVHTALCRKWAGISNAIGLS